MFPLHRERLTIITKLYHFADKSVYYQSYSFSSSHVRMWELVHKEGWVTKNWCFWAVALEKNLESPLYRKEIEPVSPKGSQPRVFIGRTDAEADTPILCHLMWRTDSLEKTLMLGKADGRRRRGMQRLRSLGSITYSMNMNLSKLWEAVKDGGAGMLRSMGSQRVRYDLAAEQQQHRYVHCGMTDGPVFVQQGLWVPSWASPYELGYAASSPSWMHLPSASAH